MPDDTHLVTRAWKHLGYRGLFLLLVGVVQAGYGSGLLTAARYPARDAHWWPAAARQAGGLPLGTWGIIWLAAAATCLVSAWFTVDQIGYATAELLTAGWAALAMQRWITTGEPGAWAPAVIYAGVAAGILLVSRWPEPVPPISLPPLPGQPGLLTPPPRKPG